MYNAEEAFELLNSHHLTLNHPVEIRKQSTVEEVWGPQLEPKERTMMVSKFSEGLTLTEVDIRVFGDND
jgi:hypothetical protein